MRRKLALAVVLVVVTGAVSGGVAIAAGGGDGGGEDPLTGPRLQKAVAAALAHTGGGTVVETEAGDDGAAYGVEIRLDTGRVVEVQLDASFGVIGEEADDDGAGAGTVERAGDTRTGSAAVVPLKDAKLNIEHNATDGDTGFQGFLDGEGWQRLDVRGPGGPVLELEGLGALAKLGLTELFFETVEPPNAKTPIAEVLAALPEGEYTISGLAQENGTGGGRTAGTALLTHDIPAGPVLVSPAEGARVPVRGVVARWKPVSETITGEPVTIDAYQLVIEKDAGPHPHMIGKLGLSIYVPPSVTSIAVPDGFLEPRTAYSWEVLAIERSGNQTLSSGSFRTR